MAVDSVHILTHYEETTHYCNLVTSELHIAVFVAYIFTTTPRPRKKCAGI